MIASKGDLTKDMLRKWFEIPEGHLLHDLSEEIIEILSSRVEPVYVRHVEALPNELADKVKEGYQLYRGYFHDKSGGADAYLFEEDLNMETPDFVLIS